MEKNKGFWGRIYNWILIIGAVIVIPAGIAEFTGISLTDLLNIGRSDCIAPNVLGESESMAIFALQEVGLTPIRSYIRRPDMQEGVVVAQKPSPKESIKNCRGSVLIEINRIDRNEIYREPEANEETISKYTRKESNSLGFWEIAAITFLILMFFRFLEELS